MAHDFIAVSKGANPRTTRPEDWHFYALDATLEAGVRTAEFPDHARIAADGQVVVLVTDNATFAGEGNQPPVIRVIPKAPMLNGQPVTWTDVVGMLDPSGQRAQRFYPVPQVQRTPTGTFFLLNARGCDLGRHGAQRAVVDSAPGGRWERLPPAP